MSDVILTVIDDSTVVAQLADTDVTVVQVDYQPIDVTVAEVGLQGATGRSPIFIGDTAPSPADYVLWVDTT